MRVALPSVSSPARLFLSPSARLFSPPIPSSVRVCASLHLVLTAPRSRRCGCRRVKWKRTEVSHELLPFHVGRYCRRDLGVRPNGQLCGDIDMKSASTTGRAHAHSGFAREKAGPISERTEHYRKCSRLQPETRKLSPITNTSVRY